MDRIETVLKKGGDGSLYLEDRRTEVIKMTEFSGQKSPEHWYRIYLDQDRSLNVLDYQYHIGIILKSNGLLGVFLKFRLRPRKPFYCRTHDSINCRAAWTCLVSIVDSEGCLRYPQSLTLIYDGIERPELHRERIQVVSADSLLTHKEVLLPDDTLTIQMDIVLKQYYSGERCQHKDIFYGDLLDWSFEINSRYQRLRLDSLLGELLRKESRYFEGLCATNMVEKNTGFLEIPEEEEETFKNMVKILSYPDVEHESYLHLDVSIEDILDVYRMSHLYEIESVLQTCRLWLRQICRKYLPRVTRKRATAISRLAETYEDPILREIAQTLIKNKDGTVTKSDVEHELWTCEPTTRKPCEVFRWTDDPVFRFEQPAKVEKQEHVTDVVSAMSHCYI